MPAAPLATMRSRVGAMRPKRCPPGVEYRGADLHRWLAADRGAQRGAEGQQYLAESDFADSSLLRAR